MPTASDGAALRAVLLDIAAGGPDVFLHLDDARALGARANERVRIRADGSDAEFAAVVNVAVGLVAPGHAGLSRELAARMGIAAGTPLAARPAPRPASVDAIRRKLDGQELAGAEVAAVVHDIASGHLTAIELACWAAAIHTRGMSVAETVACVQAMVDSGERIDWGGQATVDVHSIGGVPGNKYAPIAVAIAAAAGLKVPKTSSRAISSACGTADFMEVLCPVVLDAERIKQVTLETGAVLAWGGGVALAPADDEIIRVEYPLGLDPPAQMVASVLAKKLAAGIGKVLIDLPYGTGAKAKDLRAAEALGALFAEVGRKVGLEVRVHPTPGGRPLGRAIGPALEAREVLQVLEAGEGAPALVEKACTLAGLLLEMGEAAGPGEGRAMAQRLLRDGSAHRKLLAIVAAQGGRPGLRSSDVAPGAHVLEAVGLRDGVFDVDNAAFVAMARAAGAPLAKGAGIEIVAGLGRRLRAGEVAFRVHAETAGRLAVAAEAVTARTPFQCRPARAGAGTGAGD